MPIRYAHEPKDVFDLYVIYANMDIDWTGTIEAARKKCLLDGEELEYRLSSFPLHLVDMLAVTNLEYISEMKSNYAAFVADLIRMI